MMKKLIIIKEKFDEIKSELFKLSIQSSIKNLSNSKDKTVKKSKLNQTRLKINFLIWSTKQKSTLSWEIFFKLY
jgi:anthranilate synthase component 1